MAPAEPESPLVARARDAFATHPRASEHVAAYVFGSVARGTSRPTSDVDIAILSKLAPNEGTLASLPLDLERDLERALGRPVQVVALERATPDFIHRVMRDGVLIFESDRAARIRFETKARREYFDVLPALLRYRRMERHTR